MASAADAEVVEKGTLEFSTLNQPVVIDNGTASIKAGFAGSSKPKVRGKARLVLLYEMSLVVFAPRYSLKEWINESVIHLSFS
jgi:hypothetical protein